MHISEKVELLANVYADSEIANREKENKRLKNKAKRDKALKKSLDEFEKEADLVDNTIITPAIERLYKRKVTGKAEPGDDLSVQSVLVTPDFKLKKIVIDQAWSDIGDKFVTRNITYIAPADVTASAINKILRKKPADRTPQGGNPGNE